MPPGSNPLEILADLRKNEETLSTVEKANAIFALSPFISSALLRDGLSISPDEWSIAESSSMAQELLSLSTFSNPSTELVGFVLTDKIQPIFKSSPHPHLSFQTGRKHARPAGGAMAMQDYYEGQLWKQHPGIANVVLWCVNALEPEAFEQMWYLIIPPVMTFLDDFDAKYKLQGVIIVRAMLPRLPKGLVKRTGVDGLIQQSLRTSLSHFQSPETPDLITNAICASVDLTLQTTSPAGNENANSERFYQLCSLLGDGIVSGIWLYAEDKPTVVQATFEALPYLIKALGMGTIRFLQVLIPQLTHSLIPREFVAQPRKMQAAALSVLSTLLDVCGSRISCWSETILDGIGRCWVRIIDDENEERTGQLQDVENAKERDDFKEGLQRFCVKLAQVCPSVMKEEYPRFLKVDKTLFQDLLSSSYLEADTLSH